MSLPSTKMKNKSSKEVSPQENTFCMQTQVMTPGNAASATNDEIRFPKKVLATQ